MSENKYCKWQMMEEGLNAWEGTCGVAWILEDGTPSDNCMNYCPRCGRPLRVVVGPAPLNLEMDEND